MLLGQLGQLEGKQYLFMLNAKKTSEKKLTLIKNRLEHRVFCFDFLSLLFRRFIKGWINWGLTGLYKPYQLWIFLY